MRVTTQSIVDKDDNIWCGTEAGGLAKFDGKTWEVYQASNSGITENWISSLAFDNEGRLWIGTLGGGLICKEGRSWSFYNMSNS